MVSIKTVVSVLSLAIALIGYLPLLPHLDTLARWFFPGALLLGMLLERQGRSPGGRVLTPLSILLFLYYAFGFSMASVVAVTSNLLVVLLAVRMLGEKSGRNYLQIFALALFCLAASSLYTLSALFLVNLLLLLLLLAVSLVILTFQVQDREIVLSRFQLKKVLSVSLILPVASLPLMVALFFLMPRTPYPLWSFLSDTGTRQVGFTDKVTPGAAASVTAPKNVAFRAVCPRLPEKNLYWRGIVLNGYSGESWVRLPLPEREGTQVQGVAVEQEIFPEPSQSGYLIALNVPRLIGGVRHQVFSDRVFTATPASAKRISYRASSTLTPYLETSREIDRSFYLRLPRTVSTRLRDQGRVLSRQGGDAAILTALEVFFRSRGLAYATTALPTGENPLDSFLYEKRRGNCEYFASSAALLLRLAGVPARLVGGYRGGMYNEMGGYYLVTDDTAHVWVEAFVEGKGWVTVDPSEWSQGFARQEGVASRLRIYLDLVGFYWNRVVITYDLEKQMTLMRVAAQKVRGFTPPTVPKRHAGYLALTLAAAAGLGWWWRQRPASREEMLLRRFLRLVRHRHPGAETDNPGLYELAERTGNPHLEAFASVYGNALYRDRSLSDPELRACKELLRRARQHPS